MNFKNQMTTVVMALLLSSCGQSIEEKAATEKKINDSILNVGAQRIKDSIAYEQNKAEIAMKKEEIQEALQQLRVELIAENAKMAAINEYQLLRSAAEKEQQINSQAQVIERIEKNIQDLVVEMESL